jgi:hypothetical protein
VSRLGVVAGQPAKAGDGALVALDQPAGLSDAAAAILQMFQHTDGLVSRQVAMEQGGGFGFGEARLAGLAPQQAARLARPGEAARRDVAAGGCGNRGSSS